MKLLWFSSFCLFAVVNTGEAAQYYGKSLGKLSEFHHGVSGHVYAVDGRTLFIKDFTYDGEGPAAFFYVGNTKAPSNNGAIRLKDERGSSGVLKRYNKKSIVLSLPEGKTFHSIRWFSIWCDEFSVNFGDVKIPKNMDFPKPQKLSRLSGVHSVSSDPIVIVDAQTLLIPNFSYDGEAPDAKFWVGRDSKPSPQGIRIPDENGKEKPLRKYDHKTIVLTLPGDLTVFDIGHFGVWCEAFTVDFGHIVIPEITNVPPSLKMLGISPQKRNQELVSSTHAAQTTFSSGNRHTQAGGNKNQKYQDQNTRATTYRPPSRFIGGGISNLEQQVNRFEAPLNVNDASFQLLYSIAPSTIHRRADDFQPPQNQQLDGNAYQALSKDALYGQKPLLQYQQNLYTQPNVAQVISTQQQLPYYHTNQQFVPQPQIIQPQYTQQAYQVSQYQSIPVYQTHQVYSVQQSPHLIPQQQQPLGNFAHGQFDLDLGGKQLSDQQSGRSFGQRFATFGNTNAYVQQYS